MSSESFFVVPMPLVDIVDQAALPQTERLYTTIGKFHSVNNKTGNVVILTTKNQLVEVGATPELRDQIQDYVQQSSFWLEFYGHFSDGLFHLSTFYPTGEDELNCDLYNKALSRASKFPKIFGLN